MGHVTDLMITLAEQYPETEVTVQLTSLDEAYYMIDKQLMLMQDE